MALLNAIVERRARRAFAGDDVPASVQQLLWEAARLAPSQGNLQPTRLMVARDPGVRQAIIAALSDGNRGWASAAPLFAAIGALPSHDTTVEDRSGDRRELWAFHAGLAVANLMAQATEEGLIAHPMSGFDAAAVRAAFGAPDDLRLLTVVAVGYPGPIDMLPADLQAKEVAPRDRIPVDSLVAEDRWTALNGQSARETRRLARG